jgi:signal transduction histidine kinase
MRPFQRIVVCLIACLLPGLSLAAEPLPRSVLILDQSGPGALNPGYAELTSSFRSSIMSRSSVRIYAENLDLNNFSGPRHETRLQSYLRDKYHDAPIGVFLAVGSAALEFALELRSERWPNVPIVFAAADEESVTRILGPVAARNVIGRPLRFSLAKSVDVARALVPGLKRIALVGDPLERQPFRRHFKEEMPLVAKDLALIDLTGLPLGEVKKRLAALPNDSAILYTAVTQDGAGTDYLPYEVVAIITEVANRPIVIDVDNRIGRGGTGGPVVLPSLIGEEAAQLVSRIFNGEDPSQIPIVASDSMKPVFDWRQLQRWGVSESRLPPGSEIRFRTPSAWEQYRVLVLAAAAVLLVQAALISWLLYEQRRRRRSESAAHELSGRLINAQEEERSRLARELHDDVTQRLALLAIEAGREERNPSSPGVGTAMRTMREGLVRLSEDVHALSYRLHPSILEDLGLIEALRSECERFSRMCSTRLEVDAAEIAEKLPRDTALCLFRITQEGLRNIARHAGASRAQVSLRRRNGGLQLAVKDDGAGFDPARHRARMSLGHAGMRQRAFLLGGKLDIDSSPGHGTTIRAWVPLREE